MDSRAQQRVAERSARAAQMHTAMRDRIRNDVRQRRWDQRPIATARLAAEIWEVIRDYGDGPIVEPEAIRPALDRAIQVVKQERKSALVDIIMQPR